MTYGQREARKRTCPKCKQQKTEFQYLKTSSPFQLSGYSLYCIPCLEDMINPTNFNEVDKLMRWLDYPFLADKWAMLYKSYGKDTLINYISIVSEKEYEGIDWSDTNEKWKKAIKENHLEETFEGLNDEWLRKMALNWPGEEKTVDDYRYLEDLYNGVLTTQNVTSAIQKDAAYKLAEILWRAEKKIRSGEDATSEMKMAHDIIKANSFEPKHAKNIGNFDTLGEFFAYLEKKGFEPSFVNEQKDIVDATESNIQQYLRRLVLGEGNLLERVETKKRAIEASYENEASDDPVSFGVENIEYEGEDEFFIQVEDEDAK